MTLHSVLDGAPGPNFITVLLEGRTRALDILAKGQKLFKALEEAEEFMLMPIELEMSAFPARQLLRTYGAVRLSRVSFDLVIHIKQTRFRLDRGEKLDFALAVENYVTHQRNIVTRRKDNEKLGVFDSRIGNPGSPPTRQT